MARSIIDWSIRYMYEFSTTLNANWASGTGALGLRFVRYVPLCASSMFMRSPALVHDPMLGSIDSGRRLTRRVLLACFSDLKDKGHPKPSRD